MKNLYHSDIYNFETPVKSYWEDISNDNLEFEKLTKDIILNAKNPPIKTIAINIIGLTFFIFNLFLFLIAQF